MDTIIFTNILFTTLSIFLISATICLIMVSTYTIIVLESIHNFLTVIKKSSEQIAEDIESVRRKIIKGESMLISSFMSILSFIKKIRKPKSK